MLRDLLNGSSLMDLPVIAMLLFLAIFLGVLVWVMRRSATPHFDRMAAMPLDDEDPGADASDDSETGASR